MAKYRITSPDGGIYEVSAPDDATQEQVLSYAQQNFAPKPQVAPQQDLGQTASNFTKGLASGAADIGSNLINAATFAPRQFEKLNNAIYGNGTPLNDYNKDRAGSLEDFNRDNSGSTAFTLGRIGANVAGSLGAGGAAGTVLRGLSQTPKALALAEALRTGGFAKDVGTLTNMAGGAGANALGSLLVDPDSAPKSAAIGAALPVAGKVAAALGNYGADVLGHMGTQTGGESIKKGVQAGFEGGAKARAYADNMRGNVPMDSVIDTARQNLSNMAQQRGAQYRSGMVDISNDKSILDFNGIDDAINNALGKVTYKGQVKNQKGAEVLQAIKSEINNWKGLDPAEYHTPEGMDALKQKIGGILESIPYEERTASAVGGDIYNAIKNEINDQAPTYAKVMKDYSEASDLIHEIQKSLLGGNKATADTAMRKLQSVMRNNANTNYGNRMELAKTLEDQGGNDFTTALAGQAMNTVAPRGLGRLVAGGTALSYPALGVATIPALAAQSPRLVGEAALKAGQLAKLLRKPAALAPLAVPGLEASD